jgi:hypothetical protein
VGVLAEGTREAWSHCAMPPSRCRCRAGTRCPDHGAAPQALVPRSDGRLQQRSSAPPFGPASCIRPVAEPPQHSHAATSCPPFHVPVDPGSRSAPLHAAPRSCVWQPKRMNLSLPAVENISLHSACCGRWGDLLRRASSPRAQGHKRAGRARRACVAAAKLGLRAAVDAGRRIYPGETLARSPQQAATMAS